MKRMLQRILFLVMSAITTTRLIEVVGSKISIGNEHTDTLIFSISFLGRTVKTYNLQHEMHLYQHSFKSYWNHWQKLIETKEDVGAIWLPYVKLT